MISLLTYDAPHRKTQDVAVRLLSHGYKFTVLATPWVDRKPRRPIYAHRPAEMTWPCEPIGDSAVFFSALGVEYRVCGNDDLCHFLDDTVVIGGAGILPEKVVNEHKVLNVHPGLLPASRGLDILKWDVLELNKVGVTAHLCDDETDLGWRVLERRVPVFSGDTFHSFAMRQYELELSMITEALESLDGRTKGAFEKIDREATVARRRMGRRKESGLLPAFERFKLAYSR